MSAVDDTGPQAAGGILQRILDHCRTRPAAEPLPRPDDLVFETRYHRDQYTVHVVGTPPDVIAIGVPLLESPGAPITFAGGLLTLHVQPEPLYYAPLGPDPRSWAVLFRRIRRPHDRQPARITIQAFTHRKGHAMAEQFPDNEPILLAAVVDNAEGVPVADTLTWTATSGTVTVDATDPSTLTATLTGAAVGEVTATATDPTGLTGTVTFTIVDSTPATITVTASVATPPTGAPTPAAAAA